MSNQPPSINLVVQNGPNPGQVFAIQKRIQTIGWSPSNDIPIAEPSLSRQHARIRVRPDGIVIEDLDSTSGTFVNGQRVTGPTWLRPGDTLRLGDMVTFSVQAAQPGLPPQETMTPDPTMVPGQPPPAMPDPALAYRQPSPGMPEPTLVPSTPYPPPPGPVSPHVPPSPPTAYYYPPARSSSPWIWGGIIVGVILIVGAILAGGYYYFTVLRAPQPQPPAQVAQKPTALQAQQLWVQPTPTSTATPSPTPEPDEITVPGVPASAAMEGEPPGNIKQVRIGADCGQVEVRSDEPVAISWGWVVAKDSETDYLSQWLEAAHYDVRLDGVPITELGLLNYYRTESCDTGNQCGPALDWWVSVGILSVGAHRVTFDSYTTRAVSDGFDVNPADGELDVYGPGRVGTRSCDINVVEVAMPTPTPTSPPTPTLPTSPPTPTPAPTKKSVPTEAPASPLGVFQDFESEGTWKRGDQPHGEFKRSTAQVHSGSYAGQLAYDFPSVDNEFVVFLQTRRLAGRPNAISAWVHGDKSGHYLNIWIKDSAGEVWQAPFGQVEHSGWQRMTAWLDPSGEWPHAHVSGPSNNAIDYPISFYALVLDDIPDTFSGRGTIYVDDLASEEATPPTPTPTPTTLPPQTQPQPQPQPGGHIVELNASPNIINVGACATLSWRIENVQAAFLNGEGVTGPTGSRQVCPNSTTDYVLTVNLPGGGSDSRSVRITVHGSGPGSQYDLYVRRMDFSPNPVAGANISLSIMIATDTCPSGGPLFPATNFRWRQGDGSGWHTVSCPASTQYGSCTQSVQLFYTNPGTYNVEVQVDAVANEANTGNNSKVWTLTVN